MNIYSLRHVIYFEKIGEILEPCCQVKASFIELKVMYVFIKHVVGYLLVFFMNMD